MSRGPHPNVHEEDGTKKNEEEERVVKVKEDVIDGGDMLCASHFDRVRIRVCVDVSDVDARWSVRCDRVCYSLSFEDTRLDRSWRFRTTSSHATKLCILPSNIWP